MKFIRGYLSGGVKVHTLKFRNLANNRTKWSSGSHFVWNLTYYNGKLTGQNTRKESRQYHLQSQRVLYIQSKI